MGILESIVAFAWGKAPTWAKWVLVLAVLLALLPFQAQQWVRRTAKDEIEAWAAPKIAQRNEEIKSLRRDSIQNSADIRAMGVFLMGAPRWEQQSNQFRQEAVAAHPELQP